MTTTDPSCIYQYAFMHMQVDGEVTRCNDNGRHLFFLSLLVLLTVIRD